MRRLEEYRPVLDAVLGRIAERTSFECRPGLSQVLAENTRLIAAFSHAAPLSWLPVACLICHEACKAGGGDRVPMGVVDRFFFQVPVLRPIAQYLTQSPQPLTFDGLAEHFMSRERTDLCIFPEGSNCFFGEPDHVQEFRSSRMIELAIQTGTPILIGVHRGSEDWAQALHLNETALNLVDYLPGFLGSRLKRTGILALPMLPKRMKHFQMLCELHSPALKPEELAEEKDVRRGQVAAEGEKVRLRMIELLSELDTLVLDGDREAAEIEI